VQNGQMMLSGSTLPSNYRAIITNGDSARIIA